MSEVKRFFADTSTRTTEEYILASDFDAREKQWKEVVRELIIAGSALTFADGYATLDHIQDCGCSECGRLKKWRAARSAALLIAINDQPQEDKSHDANRP